MVSHFQSPASSFDDLPGELPEPLLNGDNIPKAESIEAISLLNHLRLDNLAGNVIWRDLVALTGTYRTFYAPSKVFTTLQQLSKLRSRSAFSQTDRPSRRSRSLEDFSTDVDFEFEVQHGTLAALCGGTVSLVLGPDGKWLIWMIRTWLENYRGHGHPDTLEPGFKTSFTNREMQTEYDVVVVGGGQAGLSLAGRLQALNLKYTLLEQNPEIGDIWNQRYESLTWHTVKEYGELPFGRTFDPEDPTLVPTKRIALAHKAWVAKHRINARTSTCVHKATWDEDKQRWNVHATSHGEEITLVSRHLVLCIGGGSSAPYVPPWAHPEQVSRSQFSGTIIHSKDYRDCRNWVGQHGVVVGTANTGHDVAEDMVEAGMHTTMLQRRPTFVLPVEWLHAGMAPDYNQTKDSSRADREAFTYPYKITRELINRTVHKLIDDNPTRFDALERAGFRLERYGDVTNNIYVRMGGHYIDTGASAKISAGQIKMKTQPVMSLTQNGLLFDDGSELKADLIVLSTGFDHDFRRQTGQIIGPIADQIDDYWGVDNEGEIRAFAKPAGRKCHWLVCGERSILIL
jgi:cation diffusion facilitator CzcD-associated flavoprotein CzcO